MSEIPGIVISAPSGTGKTTIIKRLLAANTQYVFSISTTTRSPRPGEMEGESYYFVSEGAFDRKIADNGFIEWAPVHGNRYGTERKEIDRIRATGRIPIFDVDVQGGRSFREGLPDALFIFIIPPSRGVLEKRLRDRSTETEDLVRLRLHNAERELREYSRYDYIVINDSLESAVHRIHSIIEAEPCRRQRMEQIVKSILEN